MISPAQPILSKPIRFTPEHYFYLSEHNMLGEGRTELINGEIIKMPSQLDEHAWAVTQSSDWLRSVFSKSKFWVRVQMTLHCASNVPEPDLAVIHEPMKPSRTYMTGDRSVLVIEISDSTLLADTHIKPAVYAGGGVNEYWVVDLQHRRLIVHRDPTTANGSRMRSRYRSVTIFDESQSVSCLAAPKRSVKVSKLLP
ncbi:MAG: Uma2 family endonuclease [Burkholderiales bacterium]|nr:Uma2 family endonuclease [Phycisphaerae bacterium]